MRKYPHILATAKVTLKLFLIPLQNLASAINNILMDLFINNNYNV